jgi:hypothetical protein
MKIHKSAQALLQAEGQGPIQEACPSSLEAESKCHMQINKPTQALLAAESQGP